jgi:predicted DCC family thiol-disulfide oxidoreductase YuxK
MKTGWTGGQYSLWRGAFGLLLLALCVHTLVATARGIEELHGNADLGCDWLNPDGPVRIGLSALQTLGVLGLAALASVALAVGFHDRWAAVLLTVMLVAARISGAFGDSTTPMHVATLLILHALTPRAPYGSVDARGRPDPAGGWTFRPVIAWTAWIVFTLGAAAGAVLALGFALDADVSTFWPWASEYEARGSLLFGWLGGSGADVLLVHYRASVFAGLFLAPLVLWRSLWPFSWCVLLLLALDPGQIGSGAYFPFVLRLFGLAFLFDPAWIPPRGGDAVERIDYDGECGLCQRGVRFVLAEDPEGRRFRFAPLQGETFARAVSPERRAQLPDSIVVETADGRLLVRSAAAVHVLQHLGGLWRVLGTLLALVPRPLRDWGYDCVARVRKHLLAPPPALCPIAPAPIAQRFDP